MGDIYLGVTIIWHPKLYVFLNFSINFFFFLAIYHMNYTIVALCPLGQPRR